MVRHFASSLDDITTIVRISCDISSTNLLPALQTVVMTTYDTGAPAVELADDHPGVSDPDYLPPSRRDRQRRGRSAARRRGADDRLHRRREQDLGHRPASSRRTAPPARLRGVPRRRRTARPADRPRARSSPTCLGVCSSLTGWRVEAAAGLAPIREFYGSLGDRRFMSTQYVRHPSVPLYTPEPDVIHEVIGHCNSLANEQFADLYAAAGAASRRADDDALARFSKTFWFTLEFGVVFEDGDLKAYGAGLLSSFGEMNAYRNAEIRDWDLDAMAVTDYDINVYQPVLFASARLRHRRRRPHGLVRRHLTRPRALGKDRVRRRHDPSQSSLTRIFPRWRARSVRSRRDRRSGAGGQRRHPDDGHDRRVACRRRQRTSPGRSDRRDRGRRQRHVGRPRTADDDRVRIVSSAENLGIPGGRNFGADAGVAPVLAFLDDDARLIEAGHVGSRASTPSRRNPARRRWPCGSSTTTVGPLVDTFPASAPAVPIGAVR